MPLKRKRKVTTPRSAVICNSEMGELSTIVICLPYAPQSKAGARRPLLQENNGKYFILFEKRSRLFITKLPKVGCFRKKK